MCRSFIVIQCITLYVYIYMYRLYSTKNLHKLILLLKFISCSAKFSNPESVHEVYRTYHLLPSRQLHCCCLQYIVVVSSRSLLLQYLIVEAVYYRYCSSSSLKQQTIVVVVYHSRLLLQVILQHIIDLFWRTSLYFFAAHRRSILQFIID